MNAADLDGVMALAAELREAPHWSGAVWQAALDVGNALRRIALVAEAGADVAGFAVASVLAPEAELESIGVARHGHRRGTGSLLMRALLAQLAVEHVELLLCEVRASNQAARSFYRGQGFVETGVRARYYAEPEEDAVLLELRLSGDSA